MKFRVSKTYNGRLMAGERGIVNIMLRKGYGKAKDKQGKIYILQPNMQIDGRKETFNLQISKGGIDGVKRFDIVRT